MTTETDMGLVARAIQAAKEEEKRENERKATEIGRILKEKFGLTVDTTDYPVVVDGLRFKITPSGERFGRILVVDDCAICGKEAIVGGVDSLAKLGELLEKSDKPLCHTCRKEGEPAVARLVCALEELLSC